MSGLGGDLSQLVAGALKVEQGPMPAWLQPYLDEGTAAEPVILKRFYEEFGKRPATYGELAALKDAGVIAGYNPAEQQVQVCLDVGENARVRGHCDQIVCVNPKGKEAEFAVVEAKKFRPTLWNLWMPTKTFGGDPTLTKYGWQVSALHYATGLPVYFVVGQYDPADGEILSIDVTLVTPPYTSAQVKARVLKAEAHAKKGIVPQCELLDNACTYGAEDFCLGKPDEEVIDLDDEELGALLALDWAYTQDMATTDEQKEAKKDRDDNRKKIKALVEERALSGNAKHRVWSPTGEEYEFTWVERNVKPSAGYTMRFPEVKLVTGE